MSLTQKNYINKELSLYINTYIDKKQNIYFKGVEIAKILGYIDTDQAIRKHVDEEDKKKFCEINPVKTTGLNWGSKNIYYINESGLYSLIFNSKLESAKKFKRWVTSEVLPSIRKFGYYKMFNNPNTLAFKIEDEYDLHTKVVAYIRRFYNKAIITAGLGELQDSSNKRIQSYKKGYRKGQPDLIIQNHHKYYSGMCIEFKTPLCNGVISKEQKELLQEYEDNGYKCLISNDYDYIIKEINNYMYDVRVKCKYCKRKFISRKTLKNHKIFFHKII
jgi:prophage antirepressor-like protein